MLTIYFERGSEMTAFAKQSSYEIVKCKKPCKHVESNRDAMLLLDKKTVVAKLVKCKVCNYVQLGKEFNNG